MHSASIHFLKAEVFFPNKPLQPGQLFEGKVGAYQSGALTQDKTLKLKKVFRLFKLDSWPFLLEFNSFPMVSKVWPHVYCLAQWSA